MEIYLLIPLLIFIVALFIPVLRKTLGVLFIILGTLATLTFIGAIIGIPMIIGGGILLFIGGGNPQQINIVNNVPEQKDVEERVECPFCAELIKPNAKVCRYCNRELPVKITLIKSVTCPYCNFSFTDETEICPKCERIVCECENCGAVLKDEDEKCPKCGTVFT